MLDRKITCYKSQPTACSYLEGHQSSSIFIDPLVRPSVELYSILINQGFRRSGSQLYKPDCEGCSACISVRVKTNEFIHSRRYKRILKLNADVSIQRKPVQFIEEYFELYQHYLSSQHPGGGMDGSDRLDYVNFLLNKSCGSFLLEFRLEQRLLAVAVTDQLKDGLSAVYTYYDTTLNKLSLGRLTVLAQIKLAKEMGLPYVYLGYWIQESQKMSYKNDYQPLEYYVNKHWHAADSEQVKKLFICDHSES